MFSKTYNPANTVLQYRLPIPLAKSCNAFFLGIFNQSPLSRDPSCIKQLFPHLEGTKVKLVTCQLIRCHEQKASVEIFKTKSQQKIRRNR